MKKILKFLGVMLLIIIQCILFYGNNNILTEVNYIPGDLLLVSIFLLLYLLSYIAIYMLIKDKKNKYLNIYFIISIIFYLCLFTPIIYAIIYKFNNKHNFYFLTLIALDIVIPSIAYVILSYIYKVKNITKNIFFKIFYTLFILIFTYLFCFRLNTNLSKEISYYLHKSNVFDNAIVNQEVINSYNEKYDKNVSYYHKFTEEEKLNISQLYIDNFIGNGKISDFKNAGIYIDYIYAKNVYISNVNMIEIESGEVEDLEIINTSFYISYIRDYLTVKRIKLNDYVIDFKNKVILRNGIKENDTIEFDKLIKINDIELSDNLYIEVKDSNNRIKNLDEYLSENDNLRIYYLGESGEENLISGIVKITYK